MFLSGVTVLAQTVLDPVCADDSCPVISPSPRKALLLLEAGANPHRLIEREGRAEPTPDAIAEEVADLIAAGRMPAKLAPPPNTRRVCLRTGDRLSTLARDYLLNPRLFVDIMRVNSIEQDDKLQVGQCLWVP